MGKKAAKKPSDIVEPEAVPKYEDRCIFTMQEHELVYFGSAGRSRSFHIADGQLVCESNDLRTTIVLFGGAEIMLPTYAMLHFDPEALTWDVYAPVAVE